MESLSKTASLVSLIIYMISIITFMLGSDILTTKQNFEVEG